MVEATDALSRDESVGDAVVDNFLGDEVSGVMETPEEGISDSLANMELAAEEKFSDDVRDVAQNERGNRVKIDRSRDKLLTVFGKETLSDRYLMPGESFQDLFARVALHYGDDSEHAQRLYDYMSKLWLTPSTPVLSNGGTDRGLPISCFLNEANDSLGGIVNLWNENVWLAARGGGIGSYWGNLRSIGEQVGANGKTSGIVPFIRVMDSMTLAISQGSLRRGSAAVYLPVSHPEIEEFIEMRRPTGGDPNRKALNLHHGIVIPDAFMRAVEKGEDWGLTSPKDGTVLRKVKARDLWIRILTARVETGEPYIIFIDHVNRAIPEHHKLAGLNVKMSNLCTEITLPTGVDKDGGDRTAVCCISSVNLERYAEWEEHPNFIEDSMRFLDNVLSDFIEKAPDDFEKAKYSAMRERSVGLGVMGFHSFLQSKMIPFESAMAKVWNLRMFKHIRGQANKASVKLAKERGACPDAAEFSIMERFSSKMTVAPNASTSIICGGTSPGIEPIAANSFTHKTLSGSYNVRNRHLQLLLADKDKNDEDTWTSITTSEGSVQHLDFLTQNEKDVFKTAFELDQRWIIEHAADRTSSICQSQSLNLFLPADVHKRDLHLLHFQAWKKGVKTLYYCRSKSIQRAEVVATQSDGSVASLPHLGKVNGGEEPAQQIDYDECLACQ